MYIYQICEVLGRYHRSSVSKLMITSKIVFERHDMSRGMTYYQLKPPMST